MKNKISADKLPARLPHPFTLWFFRSTIRIYINAKVKRKILFDKKDLPKQFVMVCNHPSGFDNLYAVDCLYPTRKINFISNRYYFYKNFLGKMLNKVGCIPKSIFSSDVESLKNCLRIVKEGGNLGIMADVRLSMYGQTEDVPQTTAKFIKKLGLPVYVMHFDGSYMEKPKWAKGPRKGVVEVNCFKLYDAEELATATAEDVNQKMRQAIYYDDFEWIKTRPDITYKSKKIAEGLENILYKCPHCGKEFALHSKKDLFFCAECGYTVKMDNRYGFSALDNKPLYFENLRDWFKWQKAEIAQQIEFPDYALSAHVILKKRSLDGKNYLREAGEGICTLNHEGLTYVGTVDGEQKEIRFSSADVYALSYLTGKGFQHYTGNDYFCFLPDNPLVSIKYYIASELLGKMHGAKG